MSAGLRRAGRVVVPVGLAALAVAFGAGAAGAASNLTVTRSDGTNAAASTTTSHTCFTVTGVVPTSLTSTKTTMTVVDPSGTAHAAGSATSSATQRRTISFRFGTASLTWSDACTGGNGAAPNGRYVARLSGGQTASVAFDVAVPPAAPTGLAATPDRTVAAFSWQRNAEEPDFIGYEIDDSAGHDVTGVMHPGDVCSTSTCAVSVDFGPSAAGTAMTFVARAIRSDGSGGHARSAASAPVTVDFPAAPASSPSPTASGSGTPSSGTNGGGESPAAGSTPTAGSSRSGHSRNLTGKHPAAELRAYLPTVSAGGAPDLPSVVTEVKPLPEGTFRPTLAYPDQVRKQALRTREQATTGVAHDIVQVVDAKPLWRGVAGAALLFLVVAHLRAWLARLDTADQ